MKIATFHFSLFGVNSYIVYDPVERKAALIDTGIIDDDEWNAIDVFLTRNKLSLTHIINTHLHIDHALANHRASQKYNAPVFAHAADKPLLMRMQEQADMFGLPFHVETASIDNWLTDGMVIHIGQGSLKVIHVPGHSPGGLALYDADGGFLISGDSLFAGSIGRTDLPGGDLDQLLSSIKEKLLSLPDDTVVYPGHGEATTIMRERRMNPFLR